VARIFFPPLIACPNKRVDKLGCNRHKSLLRELSLGMIFEPVYQNYCNHRRDRAVGMQLAFGFRFLEGHGHACLKNRWGQRPWLGEHAQSNYPFAMLGDPIQTCTLHLQAQN